MPQQPTFACPDCETTLHAGSSACTRCGIRLTGPEAHRLWEVDQQIAVLKVERGQLIAALAAPISATTQPVLTPQRGTSDAAETAGASPSAYAREAGPRKSLSGQQLLLGLGALLLLSAASFFLLVVWLVVGLVGQALIMVALTGAAVAGSKWATRRGLPAVAETAAALATGLLLIDLWAAHSLGLAGLDAVPGSHYWTGASLMGGLLLLTWDRLIPRQREGRPLRRIVTYRPAAATLFATTPWLLLGALAPDTTWLPAALMLVALTNLGCAAAAARVDAAPAGTTGALRSRVPVSVGILAAASALALTGHAASGLFLGYDLDASTGQRYIAFASLTVVPVLLAWVSHYLSDRTAPAIVVSALPAAAVTWAAGALGIPLMDATYPMLVGLSLLAALTAAGAHLTRTESGSLVVAAWTRVLSVVVFVSQPVLLVLVLMVTHSGHQSLHAAATFTGITVGDFSPLMEPSPLWSVLAATVWALSATVGAVSRRSGGWAFVAHTGALVAFIAALEESSAGVAWFVLLGAFAACLALACVGARRTDFIATIQSAALAPTDGSQATTPRVVGSPFWAGVERVSVALGNRVLHIERVEVLIAVTFQRLHHARVHNRPVVVNFEELSPCCAALALGSPLLVPRSRIRLQSQAPSVMHCVRIVFHGQS